jgi:prepilin-type N-terminal cleavage/methylation domain-containing protein
MGSGRGFSLLELIVVLSLVSILAGLGGLAHQTLRPRLNLSMAARELMMDLKLVRMRAVAEHVNYRIVFPGGSASYQPQRKVTGGYKNEGRPVSLPRGILIADCTARDGAISFVPRGTAGSFGTVTIRNETGEERHVSVNIAGQMRAY